VRDSLVTLNGQKLTEPVIFLLRGTRKMPAEDTEEFKLYGVLGEDHEPPKFAGEATPPIVIAPSTECLEVDGETKYMMGSRAFLLPLGNHGIPLGIPFDPAYCYCGETLAEACQAFTG
jgi:hypothetical protein